MDSLWTFVFLIIINFQIFAATQDHLAPDTLFESVSMSDFDILEQLGDGRWAKIYKVRHKKTGQIYALKAMMPAFQVRKWHYDLFRYEGQVYLSGLPHLPKGYALFDDLVPDTPLFTDPNKIKTSYIRSTNPLDQGHYYELKREQIGITQTGYPLQLAGGGYGRIYRPYILMEFIEGQTLRELLLGSKTTTMDDLLRKIRYIANTLQSLDELHQLGFFHGDLLDNNILIEEKTGQVYFTTAHYAKHPQIERPIDPNPNEDIILGTLIYDNIELDRDNEASRVLTSLYYLINYSLKKEPIQHPQAIQDLESIYQKYSFPKPHRTALMIASELYQWLEKYSHNPTLNHITLQSA